MRTRMEIHLGLRSRSTRESCVVTCLTPPHSRPLREGGGGLRFVYLTSTTASRRVYGGVETGQFYRGTSLIRNHLPLGPYSRPMRRALWRS